MLIKTTVFETLKALGLDPNDPNALQQDFAYLRELRVAGQETKRILKRYALGTFLVGISTILILGIKEWFKQQFGE